MLQTYIYRRADHCIFAWKAIRDDGGVVLFGMAKRGEPLVSGYIEFLDPLQMLALDSNSAVWLVPPDQANPNSGNGHVQDCTREVAQLMVQRRDHRNVPPLTSEQLSLYRELVARRRQS